MICANGKQKCLMVSSYWLAIFTIFSKAPIYRKRLYWDEFDLNITPRWRQRNANDKRNFQVNGKQPLRVITSNFVQLNQVLKIIANKIQTKS